MIQIYLCDDDPVILETFHALFREVLTRYGLDARIAAFSSGEQLLFYYEDAEEDPAVIFLDILMGGDNGLEAARKLRRMGCQSELVFLTSNPEYVFDSFDVSPANYILKNAANRGRMEEVLLKALSAAERKSRQMFSCENGPVQKNIPVASIYCFEVNNRMVTVHSDKEPFRFYSSLEEVEQKLDEGAFLRVHRSYLVHIACVEQLDRTSLTLTNGQVIPIGVTYAKKVKESINHYFSLFQ